MRDLREGGANCLKYLKRGWNRKAGTRHKDFKRGRGGEEGKRGQDVGALKGGGAGTPLRTMPQGNLNRSFARAQNGLVDGKKVQLDFEKIWCWNQNVNKCVKEKHKH